MYLEDRLLSAGKRAASAIRQAATMGDGWVGEGAVLWFCSDGCQYQWFLTEAHVHAGEVPGSFKKYRAGLTDVPVGVHCYHCDAPLTGAAEECPKPAAPTRYPAIYNVNHDTGEVTGAEAGFCLDACCAEYVDEKWLNASKNGPLLSPDEMTRRMVLSVPSGIHCRQVPDGVRCRQCDKPLTGVGKDAAAKDTKPKQFPGIFDLDPETREATGAVLWFCLEECRRLFVNRGGLENTDPVPLPGAFSRSADGMTDVPYGAHCYQCDKPLTDCPPEPKKTLPRYEPITGVDDWVKCPQCGNHHGKYVSSTGPETTMKCDCGVQYRVHWLSKTVMEIKPETK